MVTRSASAPATPPTTRSGRWPSRYRHPDAAAVIVPAPIETARAAQTRVDPVERSSVMREPWRDAGAVRAVPEPAVDRSSPRTARRPLQAAMRAVCGACPVRRGLRGLLSTARGSSPGSGPGADRTHVDGPASGGWGRVTLACPVRPRPSREVAEHHGVCTRPVVHEVTDSVDRAGPPRADTLWRHPGVEVRALRAQEPAPADAAVPRGLAPRDEPAIEPGIRPSGRRGIDPPEDEPSDRRVRSTRRRQDAPDLPRLPVEDRTVGTDFTAPSRA